jgi:hypothetical protein
LEIRSRDRIDRDFGQSCTGLFAVDIDFAHYNYPTGELQRYDQLVQATFVGVQDIVLELSEGFLGNTIIGLSVEPATRHTGGCTASETCLALRLGRNLYRGPPRMGTTGLATVHVRHRDVRRETGGGRLGQCP